VIKKPRTRGGYSPAKGLQNTNPQWVVAPEKEEEFGFLLYHLVHKLAIIISPNNY
jgi:hypothetical protein